jgi:hypothetical protein
LARSRRALAARRCSRHHPTLRYLARRRRGGDRRAHEIQTPRGNIGGSLYTVTLNAVQSIPKGSTLTLRFAAPTESMGK